MAKGFFDVKIGSKADDYDITITPKDAYKDEEIPANQQMLQLDIESTNNIIKNITGLDSKTKRKYALQLSIIAKEGLSDEIVRPDYAANTLLKLQDDILICEGARVKNQKFRKLGFRALIIGGIAAILGSFFWFIENGVILEEAAKNGVLSYFDLSAYLFAFAGAMAGVWVAFAVDKTEMTFRHLAVINEDRLNEVPRLIFIGVVSIIFLLFVNFGLIAIDIGEFSTDQLAGSVELLLLVGVIGGLLGNRLAKALFDKAAKTLGADAEKVEGTTTVEDTYAPGVKVAEQAKPAAIEIKAATTIPEVKKMFSPDVFEVAGLMMNSEKVTAAKAVPVAQAILKVAETVPEAKKILAANAIPEAKRILETNAISKDDKTFVVEALPTANAIKEANEIPEARAILEADALPVANAILNAQAVTTEKAVLAAEAILKAADKVDKAKKILEAKAIPSAKTILNTNVMAAVTEMASQQTAAASKSILAEAMGTGEPAPGTLLKRKTTTTTITTRRGKY